MIRGFYKASCLLGVNPLTTLRFLRGWPAFRRDWREYRRQTRGDSTFPPGRMYPCLLDRFTQSGVASGAYFHQDLLVARRVRARNPVRHVDVGSRVDGLVAHIASFREIEVLDIRALASKTPGIVFKQADLTGELPGGLVDYCDSLSCLHALEHFGLGRYGDPVRHDGHLAGFANLHRILQPGGVLYLSVPIGPQRVEFNAQRVFAVPYLLGMFKDLYEIGHFSFVDDAGNLHENVSLADAEAIHANFGCRLGCGIVEAVKR
ncbi:MAG TPA: hypothetical protein DCM68_02600 [Verrucomicrobia bacterium]|nr:hypothetical protein [Verrucomicrobiota bacterium]